MSGSVSYKFGKSGYYYDGRPLELIEVHAQSPHGLYVYSLSQSQGTIRDNKNLNNELASVEGYIAERVQKMNFRSSEDVAHARAKIAAFIDSKNQYPAFDKSIDKDIIDIEKYMQTLKETDFYQKALLALTKFEPEGVHAILTGSNYPFSVAARDFARGISHKKIRSDIRSLSPELIKRIREFAEQRSWILSHQACLTESRAYKDSVLREWPKINRSSERVDKIISRAADDLLADALAYKYYKMTGNDEIFMSRGDQKRLEQMSDSEFVNIVGWDAMQKYGSAIMVSHRINQIVKSNRDITPFMTDLNKTLGGGYVNQGVISIMFQTLSPHYNKFKNNKVVTEFISRLHYYVKDKRLANHIAETFGLKYAPKPQKEKVRQSLRAAAKRIEAGDVVSDAVVLDRKLQIERDFAVKSTKETFGKIKKLTKPTATQQEILRRFGNKEK